MIKRIIFSVIILNFNAPIILASNYGYTLLNGNCANGGICNISGIDDNGGVIGSTISGGGSVFYSEGNYIPLSSINPNMANSIPFNDGGYSNGILIGYSNINRSGYFSYDISQNTYRNITIPGYGYIGGAAENRNGAIVGWGWESVSGNNTSFVYDSGNITTLNVPDAGWTIARAINDNGYIVGDYANNSGVFGFFYNPNTQQFTTIEPPINRISTGGGSNTFGINNAGQIIMTFVTIESQYGVVYDMNTNEYTILQPPNSPIPQELIGRVGSYNYVSALGINNKGQIVGNFINGNGNVITYIASPVAVPLPGAIMLFGTGLLGFFGIKRLSKSS
jgi:hypothetical protein